MPAAQHHAGGLGRKMGPLPIWAWGLIFGAAAYIYYRRAQGASSTTTTSPGSSLDPNAIDPNTGMTYAQEEQAAMNATYPTTGALGSSSTGTTTGTDTSTTGIDTFDQELMSFLQAQQDFQTAIGQLGYVPQLSQTSTNAATSAPMTSSTPPPTSPTAHTDPLATQNNTVLGQIDGLLKAGFKKVSGTTQSGGLPETGTYVLTPPKPPKGGATMTIGPTKYFVWGTSSSGYHIRAA